MDYLSATADEIINLFRERSRIIADQYVEDRITYSVWKEQHQNLTDDMNNAWDLEVEENVTLP